MLSTLLTVAATMVQAQSPGMIVSTSWLADRLDDPGVVLVQIDGRRDAYDEGHIPGAVFVLLSDIALDTEPGVELPAPADLTRTLERLGIGDGSRVVIYSATSPLAATRLWLSLDYLGHGDHASVLDGGFTAWRAERRAITRVVPAATAGSLSSRARAPFVVGADWINQRLADPSVVLIDARPDAEYTGADGGMGGRVHPGHIPGAVQMYWEKLISGDNRYQFLPLDALRREFAEAGAGQGKTVVTYCMVGLRASLTYMVGRMLGYDMKFYDGSWHDWGGRDLPYVEGKAPR